MKRILPKNIKPWIQEGPGRFLYTWYPLHASSVELLKYNDYAFKLTFCIIKDDMFRYGYDEKDMFRIGNIVLKKTSENNYYVQDLIEKWMPYYDNFFKTCKEIDSKELEKLSEKELLKSFKEFNNSYLKEYALPMISDAMGHFLETRISERLRERLKTKGKEREFNRLITKLTKPVQESFLGEEKLELFKIAKDKNKGKDISKQLKEHKHKWYWIQNNYLRSIILDEEYFLTRIKQHLKNPEKIDNYLKNYKKRFQETKKEKKNLIKELELDKETQLLIRLAEEFTYWQDLRKKANLNGQHYISLFLKAIEKNSGIEKELLACMSGYEVIKFLKTKKPGKEILEKRKNICAIASSVENQEVLNFEESIQLEKEVETKITKDFSGDIHGSVANVGKVVGKAKIINTFKDFNKMKQGDILITSMTRPEFMPVMKKAGAIITDEGGITSHAAIVARELDIPCIVGTKTATKTLKDNDLLEVNANHGVAKVLK